MRPLYIRVTLLGYGERALSHSITFLPYNIDLLTNQFMSLVNANDMQLLLYVCPHGAVCI